MAATSLFNMFMTTFRRDLSASSQRLRLSRRITAIPKTTPRRFHLSATRLHSPSNLAAAASKSRSLTDRLKALFRENGKVALIVYIALSALDFGLTFLAIHALGAEHVRAAEDWVLDKMRWKRLPEDEGDSDQLGVVDQVKKRVGAWAERKQQEQHAQSQEDKKSAASGASTLWATAVLAYTIHKTLLLPVRIGLTAAVTPASVRQLKRLGFNVGPAKPAHHIAP